MKVKAYLVITLVVNPENRPAAAKVYNDYRQPFLDNIEGALTKELLGCVAAARGAVINISSAAAYIPVACMGAYNAVKAALRMFSVTLQMEVAGRGVHVLNVCPGRVDTGFSSRALGGRKPPETPGRTSSSAEVFAQKVFNAYRKRKRELVYPGWYWFAIVFARWFPGCCERINRRVWQLK